MFRRYVFEWQQTPEEQFVCINGKVLRIQSDVMLSLRFFYQFVWLVLDKLDQTGVLDCVLNTCIRVQIDLTIFFFCHF